MARRTHTPKSLTGPRTTLLELLQRDPERVLRVLDRYGVYFDAGTYITLTAPLEKAAAYHAVPDTKKFIRELTGRKEAA
jgi:hypothetical protein